MVIILSFNIKAIEQNAKERNLHGPRDNIKTISRSS